MSGILKRAKLDFAYEPYKIKYVQPQVTRTYLPDWGKDNIILEAKGQFTSADRKKMLLLKEQHPDKTFVMIFGNARNTLTRKSNTTYAAWCDKNNIPWFDLTDFERNPKSCLSSLTPQNKLGNAKTSRRRKKPR